MENKNYFSISFYIFEIQLKYSTFSKKKMTLIAEVFSKLRSPKKKVRSKSKKASFKGSFGKQHGKWTQTLLKLASQHLYQIY